jgi:hypothetical protein
MKTAYFERNKRFFRLSVYIFHPVAFGGATFHGFAVRGRGMPMRDLKTTEMIREEIL